MGLDMYLTRKFYVKNWRHTTPKRIYSVSINRGGKKSFIPTDRILYIETEEIYWRKANQIHKWFVDHVQGGKDDCGTYYVDEKQLTTLLDTVRKVLASTKLRAGMVINGYQLKDGKMTPVKEKGKIMTDSTLAKELLPTTAGCFFGGTEYDQWYYEDLKNTEKNLSRLINELASTKEGEEYGDFYYHSSW